MGMKRVLTAVVVLSSVLVLASCQKTTIASKTDKVTTQKQTTQKQTTEKKTTSKKTTSKKTTTRQTTTRQTTTRRTTTEATTTEEVIVIPNNYTFYNFSGDIQLIVNDYYGQVKSTDGAKTLLNDGSSITWVQFSNETSVYSDNLDRALANDQVDLFMFEAGYRASLIDTNLTMNLDEISSLDTSKQYDYAKNVVTFDGKLKGLTWYVTPGVTLYNVSVAKAIFGNDVSASDMAEKLGDKEKFFNMANAIKEANKGKYTLIGYDELIYLYAHNIKNGMYSNNNTIDVASDDTIVVDPLLFEWAKDTKTAADAGYIRSLDNAYNRWGLDWGYEIAGNDTLCVFGASWFSNFVVPSWRVVEAGEDSGLRIANSYTPWFWGGSWIGAAAKSFADENKAQPMIDLLASLTTDDTTMTNIAKGNLDVPNNTKVVSDLAKDNTMANPYYGGQNVFGIYDNAIKDVQIANFDNEEMSIVETIQSAFKAYIDGSKSARAVWAEVIDDLYYKLNVASRNVLLPNGETDIDNLLK